MSDRRGPVRVIGVGSPVMGDDGLGLAALRRLGEAWELPAGVELHDGGTWGVSLLPLLEDASAVLLLDAVDLGLKPGTIVELTRERLPRAVGLKVSPHQADLREVVALAELRGTLPARTVVVGAQAVFVELSCSLSPECAAAVDEVAATAAAWLRAWGFEVNQREAVACTR